MGRSRRHGRIRAARRRCRVVWTGHDARGLRVRSPSRPGRPSRQPTGVGRSGTGQSACGSSRSRLVRPLPAKGIGWATRAGAIWAGTTGEPSQPSGPRPTGRNSGWQCRPGHPRQAGARAGGWPISTQAGADRPGVVDQGPSSRRAVELADGFRRARPTGRSESVRRPDPGPSAVARPRVDARSTGAAVDSTAPYPLVPAPVAQLDRASVYGTEGQRFESSRARSRIWLRMGDFGFVEP